MTNEIDRLINFDAISEAEKTLGEPSTNPRVMDLALLLAVENGAAVRDEMSVRMDTHYGMPFLEAVDIAVEEGFTAIYAGQFTDTRYEESKPVSMYMYWKDGVLLVLESWYDRVNRADIYFNWRSNDGQTSWTIDGLGYSGGWERYTPGYDGELVDDPWTLTAHIDVRLGLKHKLDRIRSQGTVLREWYIQPMLHLVSYAENGYEDVDIPKWRQLTADKVESFPPQIRDMIFAAKGRL